MRAWRWQTGLAAVACAASALASAGTLRIVTEHGPPTNMREGDKIIGIGTDKLREALSRTGFAYTIELMPWKLAYSFALNEPATCVFAAVRDAEREAKFKWIGPIDEIEWVLFARADRPIKLTSIDDARGKRIGTYKGDVSETFLRGKGFIVDTALDTMLNPGKLMAGRIDLWVTTRQGGNIDLARLGLTDKIVPVLSFKQSELFMACNRAVSDETVASLNAALAAMRADGSAEAIDRKYVNWRPPPRSGD
jgi:polar amino acid transport system substrate-binding protein